MKKAFSFLAALLLISLLTAAVAESAEPRLSLSETEVRLEVGKKVTLKAKAVNHPEGKKGKAAWESSDPAVCSVSASGQVKALGGGEAVIRCTMTFPDGSSLEAECSVHAFVKAKKLKAVNESITLGAGESVTAECAFTPEDTTDKTLEWSSSNEAVATVDAGGNITATGAGTAKITGQTKDGSKKKAVFKVTVPVLSVSETEYTLSDVRGVTVPISYCGENWEKNVTVKVSGKPVAWTAQAEGFRVNLHLDAREAGDSKIVITDKKNKKAKITLKVHTEEAAISPNVLAEFTQLKFTWEEKGLVYHYKIVNHSSRTIVSLMHALDFRTAEGKQIFFTRVYEGQDVPTVAHYWTSEVKIKPGEEAKDAFYVRQNGEHINNREITEIRGAICIINFDDGSSIKVPVDQFYWCSSVSGYLEKPEIKDNNFSLSPDIAEKVRSFSPGFSSVEVDAFEQACYGVSEKGIYVTRIDQGSVAEKCGLKLKDLIYEADGIRYTENHQLIYFARAKMADGETVVFKVERDGEKIEIEMRPDAQDAATE